MLLVGGMVTLVALAAIDVRATYGARISVDEPQYLLTAISLAEDLDLDISDELAERRYLPFHEVALSQQTIALDESGRQVSPHDPLLPVLLAVPMKLGGWVGARIAMALMAGVAAALTFFVAHRRLNVSARVAGLVVVGFFASPPMAAYGTQIYPAMPAAICVLIGLAVLLGESRRHWWLGVLSVVALPWLAVKYVPLSVVVAVALLWSLRSFRRVQIDVVVSLVVMGLLYLWFHRQVYGGWTVYASGDHFVDGEWQVVGTQIDLIGRSRRVVGLFVDRGFGIGAWAPGFLAGPAALVWLVRRRSPDFFVMPALVLAGWAVATWVALTMHGWWWPGRQVVPVLAIFTLALAAAADQSQRWLAGVGAACVVSIFSWFWLVVEASTGRRALIVDFEQTANPLYRAWRRVLPDHRQFELASPWLTLVWTALLVASCVLAWRSAGRASHPLKTTSIEATP